MVNPICQWAYFCVKISITEQYSKKHMNTTFLNTFVYDVYIHNFEGEKTHKTRFLSYL